MPKLVKAILIFFKCKFDFKLVKKEKLLIFDTSSLELASKFKKFEILDVRYKVFNFWLLLENFLKLKFTFKDYILAFISKVNPKVVLTFNDNYLFFYELKNYFPEIKFIAVQNGNRHKSQLDEFKKHKNKKLFVDYLFTFGENSEISYKKYIKCNNFIHLGSFRNNSIKLKKSSEKKNILFISQFRAGDLKKGDEYTVESKIIKIINIFCVKKKIKLFVAPASIKIEKYLEEKYFLLSKLPEKHNVQLIRKKKKLGNYSLINKFETIVFVDSTLGYEAIARKKKIVAISVRKKKGKIIYPFGFPTIKSNKDFFFTNFDAKKEIFRVLNNVYSLPLKKWLKNYQEKLNVLMSFNKDNIRLIKTISKLIN